MKWLLALQFVLISILVLPEISYGFSLKRLQSAKRAQLQVTVGAPDYYNSLDSHTITFTNTGRGKTGILTTTLTEPGFVFFITVDTCHGNELAAYQSCSVTVQYTHPGSYPQNGLLELTSPLAHILYGVNSCNPSIC
jgi:hypothetical protein